MKNKVFEVLLIILLVNFILLGFSFISEIDLPFGRIRFYDFNTLTDFSIKYNSEAVDSLINSYLDDSLATRKTHRPSLCGLGPKIKNTYLVNPDSNNLYALDGFFSSLIKEKNAKVVHIAHYGDSQLEGDRITCYLRGSFQNRFGGSGVGFMPFDDIADNVNFSRTASPNWIRYTVFHNRYGSGYYGLSGNVYKFSSYAVKKTDERSGDNDTTVQKTNSNIVYNSATLSYAFRQNVSYSNIWLMYGHASAICNIKGYNGSGNETFFSDTLGVTDNFTLRKLAIPASTRSFKLEFSGETSPEFYGLLADGQNGIQVDNYAIRGHSGDGLLLASPGYFANQLKKLNVKLIVFQYGANVVPYVTSDKRCELMEDMYYKIFSFFKKIAPDISILVISAGDMSTMINGEYASYPYLPKIRDAQKNAALRSGCAFYDLFEVMGGSNSILNWSKKGLASHDGHFTAKGQKIIGKQLFDALMIEYNQYKYRQRKKSLNG